MRSKPGEVTRLLGELNQGDSEAFDRLLPLVYSELRGLADSFLNRERADHTLQPTALVHEAYLKLVNQKHATVNSREHFLAVAATAMRRVLVSHARSRHRIKRGRGYQRMPMTDSIMVGGEPDVDLVALDEAMSELARLDPRKVQVVELRYFVGLGVKETADVVGVSPATVKRDWEFARTWLMQTIEGDDESS